MLVMERMPPQKAAEVEAANLRAENIRLRRENDLLRRIVRDLARMADCEEFVSALLAE